jgi:hypothetical protein
MIRRLVIVAVLLEALLAAAPRVAHAQNPVLRPDTIEGVADTIPTELPVPRGAFIRALLIPGWGHLYIDAPRRGAVYFALQSASWFMLIKTIRKLDDVRDEVGVRESAARDSLDLLLEQDTMRARQYEENPALYEAAINEIDAGLQGRRSLIISRERHRQDWIVYTLFFTFASAIDAYVSAHLADFPGEITTSRNADGGFTIGVQLNVGVRRP